MKKVSRTSQIKVKTKTPKMPKCSGSEKVKRTKTEVKDPFSGKSSGTGLDDYNLNIMELG